MHGAATTPAGNVVPPIVIGRVRRRPTSGHDGSQPQRLAADRVEVLEADHLRIRAARAVPRELVEQRGRGRRVVPSTWLTAQASAVAVVSWPASSIVISSSRSAWSSSGWPSSSRGLDQQRRGRRRGRSTSACRRAAISANSSRSTRSRAARKRATAAERRRRAARCAASNVCGFEPTSADRAARRAGRASSGPSSRPKTVRRITSSVTPCISRVDREGPADAASARPPRRRCRA